MLDVHFNLIKSVPIADSQDVVVVMKLNRRVLYDKKRMSVRRKAKIFRRAGHKHIPNADMPMDII